MYITIKLGSYPLSEFFKISLSQWKFYFIPCYPFTDNNPVEINTLTAQRIIDKNFKFTT